MKFKDEDLRKALGFTVDKYGFFGYPRYDDGSLKYEGYLGILLGRIHALEEYLKIEFKEQKNTPKLKYKYIKIKRRNKK